MDTEDKVTFEPITRFSRGTLLGIISSAYAPLMDTDSSWKSEKEKFQDFDDRAYDRIETIGSCVFVTCLNGMPLGVASFNPRGGPAHGVIGQNAVVPKYQGQGYGRRQIEEVLDRFKRRRIQKVLVVTNCHPFFFPATKMYESLGFKEVRRFAGGPDPKYELIELEKDLEV